MVFTFWLGLRAKPEAISQQEARKHLARKHLRKGSPPPPLPGTTQFRARTQHSRIHNKKSGWVMTVLHYVASISSTAKVAQNTH
jgi:hypothetical protein